MTCGYYSTYTGMFNIEHNWKWAHPADGAIAQSNCVLASSHRRNIKFTVCLILVGFFCYYCLLLWQSTHAQILIVGSCTMFFVPSPCYPQSNIYKLSRSTIYNWHNLKSNYEKHNCISYNIISISISYNTIHPNLFRRPFLAWWWH